LEKIAMPLTAFMKADPIVGSGLQKGREGEIPVIGFHHEITTEIDPGTGDLGKTRLHSAFVIQKEVDLSTPAFHQHQTNGAAIPLCTIRLFHMPKSGPEAHYFTIKLKNAKVVSVKTVMPPAYDPNNSNIHEYEEVALEYSEITWEKIAISGAFATGNESGSPEYKDKIGEGLFFTGGVFLPDWLETQARVAVLKAAAELKAAGFEYGKNLYQSTLLKAQGKPPAEPPPEDK
jgi:type VI secretion system secreted protein Hcp